MIGQRKGIRFGFCAISLCLSHYVHYKVPARIYHLKTMIALTLNRDQRRILEIPTIIYILSYLIHPVALESYYPHERRYCLNHVTDDDSVWLYIFSSLVLVKPVKSLKYERIVYFERTHFLPTYASRGLGFLFYRFLGRA